ncbi:MAG: flagellar export chaperone FliS [Acetivibrio ethanolgignens]
MKEKKMATNAAMIYKNNTIQTASPAELTLMLYEGAIKFANIALMAMEKGDIQKAHDNIVKTENIIMEFRATLDHKYPVWEDFDRVYDYIYRRLVEANMKKDKEIMEEALGYIREMRDTWKEVMQINQKRGANG